MYDILVIGGGPGGYAAAIRAAQLGAKAAVVEAAELGGTCVNRGCIPTKVWHRAAELVHRMQQGESYGIVSKLTKIDLNALKGRKDGVANDIRMGMGALLSNNGVELLEGTAQLKNSEEVAVDGRLLQAKKIILATGSVFDFPDVPGLKDAAISSNEVLELTSLPDAVLIWGGGPIQVEFASFLQIFGVQTTLVESGGRILPEEDGETSQRVAQGLRELGVQVVLKSQIRSVRSDSAGWKVSLSGPEDRDLRVDRILLCERKPNTEDLGLQNLGIRCKEKGAVEVDEKLETSQSGIYAIGDCTGGWMLSHAATAMGITAAENAMGQNKKFPFRLVSRAIWSIPEVGSVGLSEEAAEKEFDEVETGNFPYAINGLGMARGEITGEVKMVFQPEFGEILGVHIVGAQASELIGEAVLAMQLECTVQELATGFRAHPTFSESVVDAARDAKGWALYVPKR